MLGDCFEVHGTMLLRRKAEGMLLVHGEVAGQGKLEGERFGHCWLEKDDMVYDYSNGHSRELPRYLYYAIGQVVNEPGKLYKYTGKEARAMMLEHEHFGWWELTCTM